MGEIEEQNILAALKWLAYENLDHKTPRVLTLYINSPGGDLYHALALIDMMKASPHTIRTVAVGSIMSAAFLIFVSGNKGERYIAPGTGVMCHQFSDSMENKYHDLKAAMKEGDRLNARMLQCLRDATGLPTSKIKTKLLSASDAYLTVNELIELNGADFILGH
jgi:ATP-dependent Clp protease protease subunit